MPGAADLARQRVASHFGAAHYLSVLRTALNLGRKARLPALSDRASGDPIGGLEWNFLCCCWRF